MKSYNKIIIYKNKFNVNLISIIFFIIGILATANILSIYKQYVDNLNIRVIAVLIFNLLFIIFLFGCAYYFVKRSNNELKNIHYIKENGNVYGAEIVHILKENRYNSTTELYDDYTYFIVKFKDRKQEEKLIITKKLPNEFNNVQINDSDISLKNDDYIEINEYFGEGFITFEEDTAKDIGILFKAMPSITINGSKLNEGKQGYSYTGSISKNYNGNIKCKVYEDNGRYVIDDYEGIEYEKSKSMSILDIFILFFFTICTLVLYYT